MNDAVTRKPLSLGPSLFLAAMLVAANAAWAEDEPAATAPLPQAAPPSAAAPMNPAHKEAPAAATPSSPPAIALPAEPPAAKPDAAEKKTTGTPAGKPDAAEKKTPATPAGKPGTGSVDSTTKAPEKTVARPKRPTHRHAVRRQTAPEAPSEHAERYPYPSGRRERDYQGGYTESWREGGPPGYRTPAPYSPPRVYEREEVETWRAEPYAYRYAPPPVYYRELPPGFAPYPGPPPPWPW